MVELFELAPLPGLENRSLGVSGYELIIEVAIRFCSLVHANGGHGLALGTYP
jgi:hypothetical protein